MDIQTIFKDDPPNYHMKPEPDPEPEDDFPIQDLQQLDNFCLMGPSFHPDYGIHASGYDPFGPFPYESASDDLEFKPFELDNGCDMMQNSYTGYGFLTHSGNNYVGVSELDHFVHVSGPTQDPKPVSCSVPDEGSCVTGESGIIKTSNGNPCKGKKKTYLSKGQWSKEEDRVLKQLVEKNGGRKWSYIAQMLKGRIGKQCRERWHNHLKPDIKKDFWTEEEDLILITAHAEIGNKWSEIAKKLPGRTENSIKNHWNATKRRLYTKRKCRSKWPKPSPILQNYIKSLNLPCGKSKPSAKNIKLDNPLTMVKTSSVSSSPSQNELEFYSNGLVTDFDFNEVPEFALDDKLLETDSIESFLDDISTVNYGTGSGSIGVGDGEKINKEIDLMEMVPQVNF
ncbi:transcription factor MYB115-like [Rutidosis leptorrhynchoides]|uniref:transcription factor MYB115-like n=1 Tax=Rutidosis leptorrhynchoides TaxID=125765 RepID=UPI003A9A2C3C